MSKPQKSHTSQSQDWQSLYQESESISDARYQDTQHLLTWLWFLEHYIRYRYGADVLTQARMIGSQELAEIRDKIL